MWGDCGFWRGLCRRLANSLWNGFSPRVWRLCRGAMRDCKALRGLRETVGGWGHCGGLEAMQQLEGTTERWVATEGGLERRGR